MRIAVEPFEPQHEAAAAAFNDRMRGRQAPSAFLLPTRARPPVARGAVTVSHYVAVDAGGEVRGGLMCVEHPAVLAGRIERVVNVQSPLSEGIVDPAFTLVGPHLIRHVTRQWPHAFVVGMGHAANPLPRLLKALGWTLHTVPFYFRVLRAARCVRNLGPLRSTALRRAGGAIAAATGIAAAGAALAHRPSREARLASSRFAVRPVQAWTPDADAVWSLFRDSIGFAVLRTTQTLPFFYSFGAESPRAWWLLRDGRIEGWFGLLVSAMQGNPYFGDLIVATLTDCVGTPAALRAAMPLAAREAREAGADLIITNQQHVVLRDSCAAAGWRTAPSNFLLATSRALTGELTPHTTYVTRRDGDGLTNLRG